MIPYGNDSPAIFIISSIIRKIKNSYLTINAEWFISHQETLLDIIPL